MFRLLSISVFVLLVFAGSAAAQQWGSDVRSANRVALYGGGGFGGQYKLHVEPPNGLPSFDGSGNLDASGTVGLRFAHPFHDYFLVATDFRMIRWRAEGVSVAGVTFTADRNTLLDFSILPTARYVFAGRRIAFEPYLSLPLGLTINVFQNDPGDGLGKGSAGWHIGFLAGLAVHSRIGLGGFVELGWLHHATYDHGDSGTHYRGTLDQMALHLGVSYLF